MDLTSVLGSILNASQSNGSLGAAANHSSVDMGALLKQLAGNNGSDIFGTILKSVAANAGTTASANAGLQSKGGDVLGTILNSVIKGTTASTAGNAQAQNGNVLGAILGQAAGQKSAMSNMSGSDILNMATQASNILNSILGKK